MDIASHAYLMTAAVTILAGLLYFYMGVRVGSARGKYDVKAPATSGHPLFERAYRIHMNTLEAFPVFFPALWLATVYFHRLGWLPAALGAVWIIGRILYMTGYTADPTKRGLGFGIASLAQLALVVLAIIGIVTAWGPM